MTGVPESPYKGLASFEDSELDALLFFGREREIAAVAANVLANRLTVLYGPSGVGKSSLLGAGVARRLRELSGAPVVVHDAWAEDPAARLIASVHAECGELGATAGLVDTVAAAAQQSGELHLLLDNFEEYVLYHGLEGPLSDDAPGAAAPARACASTSCSRCATTLWPSSTSSPAGSPSCSRTCCGSTGSTARPARAAILGPLARYSELAGETFTAEDALVEAVLDEASTDAGVEAPYLQLVLERLWEREREEGSRELRLATFRAIGGARAVVREHVQRSARRACRSRSRTRRRGSCGSSSRRRDGRSRTSRPTSPSTPTSTTPSCGACSSALGRERIVRGVNGMQGAPTRYEIFHDVLGPPILAWQAEHQLRRERIRARRQRRRLLAVIGASLVALAIVAAIAAFALVQRSDARTQARHAHGGELAGRALADIPTNPQVSVDLALQAASARPGTPDRRRPPLEPRARCARERILRLGGNIVAAPRSRRSGEQLCSSRAATAGSALYDRSGTAVAQLARQPR